jgi:PAS domain-containing protein
VRVESATKGSEDVQSSGRDRIRVLLERLGSISAFIILLAALAVAASFYLLQAKPLAQADAQIRQEMAANSIISQVEAMVRRVERTLLMAKEWSQAGLLNLDDIQGFNRLLIPVLAQDSIVSSIYLARDDGRMFYLQRSDGIWKNRITDVARQGQQQHWLHWRYSAHEIAHQIHQEWKTQDYDPRKRPWFQGAMATEEQRLHWTPPYLFTVSPEPGITASVRWRDPGSGQNYVLSLDILLQDLSSQTSRLEYGKNGQLALLTADGKLLGLPNDPHLKQQALGRDAVLKTPKELGLNLLAEALRLTQNPDQNQAQNATQNPDDSGEILLPAGLAGNSETWQVHAHPLRLHNQQLLILTLAPLSDFRPISDQLLLTLITVMLVIAVLALMTVRFLVSRVRRPITRIYSEMEQTQALLQGEMQRRGETARIGLQLQGAKSVAELGRMLLSNLSTGIRLQQGLFCIWDQSRRQASLMATYGGGAELDAQLGEPGKLGGLVDQCARQARPILLEGLERDYFKIQSGLGDSAPRCILLHPIRYQQRVFGVLELASFTPFSEAEQKLLEELETLVALSLNMLLRAEETQSLLQQTRQAEERNRLMLEQSPVALRVASLASGRLLFANPAYMRLLQIPDMAPDHIDPARFYQNPEDLARIQQRLRRGEEVRDVQLALQTWDGRPLSVLGSYSAIEYAGDPCVLSWFIHIQEVGGDGVDPASQSLRPNQSNSAAQAQDEALQPLLIRLEQLLSADDAESVEFWSAHEDRLLAGLGAQLGQQLGEALASYEFDTALRRLRAYRNAQRQPGSGE